MTWKTVLKKTTIFATIIFAIIGALFTGMYFAIRFGWTNESGEVDYEAERFTQYYEATKDENVEPRTLTLNETTVDVSNLSIEELEQEQEELENKISSIDLLIQEKEEDYCLLATIASIYPELGWNVQRLYNATHSKALIERIALAQGIDISQKPQENCEQALAKVQEPQQLQAFEHLSWTQNEEWDSISTAILKDQETIEQVADIVDIEARMLTTPLIVEQLRLFHTQRALFKQFFQPLSILASATKTSWGVMSIKEHTAISIEEHLKDSSSPYYLGEEYADLLDFSTNDPANERYERLTREDDHYYSYLYGALYIKQLLTQWENAGYPIDDRPEIVATLFNIGFTYSNPKENPQVGGATIPIGETTYTFGSLGYEYYFSTVFMDMFPYKPL